jgi:alpha-tubulin suppressor-like RCC1 family protein
VRIPQTLLALAAALAVLAPAAGAAPQVFAGGSNTCAVVNGAALCWGANGDGQVGNGTFSMATTPTQVQGLASGVEAIVTSGAHSCAIVNGGAWCWGNNDYGQLGNNSGTDSPVPVAVAGLGSGVTAIAVGDIHSCAVHNGGAKCWGSGGYGQLGTGGSIFSSAVPVAVSGLGANVSDVSAGKHHSCARINSGGVLCWGRGDSGEMGNGSTTYINQGPVGVSFAGLPNFGSVSSGAFFSCATRNGGVDCWGFGGQGRLGNGGSSNVSAPTAVVGSPSNVNVISAGNGLHACARGAGTPVCWGGNNAGQLGNAAFPGGSNVPVSVQGLPSGVLDITAGELHTCAATDTAIYCWGSNANGQLGTGSQNGSGTPVLVMNVPAPPANPARLVNISTRMQVLTGDNVMIGGLTIGGSTPKTVVIRARGPSLTAQGVPGVLADPVLQLFSGPNPIGINDDWTEASNAAAIQASGYAPLDSLESAIMVTLDPGGYTAIVSGYQQGTGVGIIEVFEVDQTNTPLINIATRGRVLTGADVMIAGFIIQGDGPQNVVVRARGPSLTAAGVTGVLANPQMQLFSGPTQIGSNDNWGNASNAAQIQSSGFAPLDPLESAIMVTLQPGAYTAIVTGVAGGTGVAIVEVFKN